MSIQIRVKRTPQATDLPLPIYQTADAAGLDLHAAVMEPVLLEPGDFKDIPCGLQLALPSGYEGQIRPRSGLAVKHGITVLNSPGTIDSDYRGEVRVILINHGKLAFRVTRGMRIAQLVIAQVHKAVLTETNDLPPTQRSQEGFGHTGE